jgi:hypothetical protein
VSSSAASSQQESSPATTATRDSRSVAETGDEIGLAKALLIDVTYQRGRGHGTRTAPASVRELFSARFSTSPVNVEHGSVR